MTNELADALNAFSDENLEIRLKELQRQKPALVDNVIKSSAKRNNLLDREKELEAELAQVRKLFLEAENQRLDAENALGRNEEDEAKMEAEIEYRELGNRRACDLTTEELSHYANLRAERDGYADDPLD